MIVHLNGWPGVGKKTVGAVLAEKLSARFVHNHVLHDVAIACCGVTGEERWTLYERIRGAAYSALAARPPREVFVMTNALCTHAPRELDAWRKVVGLAMQRNVPLVPIVLEASEDENLRRVASAERVGKKLSDPDLLRSFFHEDTIQRPDVLETLVLDVTRFSPAAAANEIAAYVTSIAPSLAPATAQHLVLR